jgi:hypothetical protein
MVVVEFLRTRYLPLLDQMAIRLREKHPSFTINFGSHSVGDATAYQGYDCFVVAFRLNSADPEPNCVALEIGVRDLTGIPTLCGLDVTWGGDGVAPSEAIDLLNGDVRFGPEAVRLIDEALPRLEQHLDQCLYDWEAAYPQSR